MKKLCFLICLLVFLIALSASAADMPFRHDFPRVGEYEVITGDFHMHTLRSDGKLSIQERLDEAVNRGYDVVSVTDHWTMNGYRMAKDIGGKLGLVVLCGYENVVFDTKEGKEHMNVIGLSDIFKAGNQPTWCEVPVAGRVLYRDGMSEVAADGGIIIYNHPHVGYREPTIWGIEKGYLIGIEVANDQSGKKWGTTEFNGVWCYPDAFDFALEHNLTMFADTDSHGQRKGNPARTLLLVKDRTPEGVMDALRGRRTAAWFGGMLWGREALLSELIGASVTAGAEGKKTVFENRSPIALKGIVNETSFELPAYGSAAVDVKRTKPISVTWTNVWTSSKTNLTTLL